jgi:predicted permease
MALAVMLLIGAGLLVGSFQRLQNVDLGFEPERVLTVQLGLGGADYPNADSRIRFFEDAFARIEALPGVVAAGATNVMPLSGGGTGQEVRVEGFVGTDGTDIQFADWRAITSGFFDAAGLTLLRGRLFTAEETREGLPLLVVTEELANRFWPDQDPIGKRIAFGTRSTNWNTVIGVVHNMRDQTLRLDPLPVAFAPYGAIGWPSMAVLVRTASDPELLAAAVRAELRAVNPGLPVPNVQLLRANVDQALAGPRFNLFLMTLFAAVALILGAVGIYGVTRHAVDRRTREIGLRLALGATPRGVIGLVVRQGFGLVAIGAAIGVAGAIGLTRFMEILLYETRPLDPASFAAAVGVLVTVALIASVIPAYRAGRVDPKRALDSA